MESRVVQRLQFMQPEAFSLTCHQTKHWWNLISKMLLTQAEATLYLRQLGPLLQIFFPWLTLYLLCPFSPFLGWTSYFFCRRCPILGPLLFCLTLFPLSQCLTSHLCVCYLDDASIRGSCANILTDLKIVEEAESLAWPFFEHPKIWDYFQWPIHLLVSFFFSTWCSCDCSISSNHPWLPHWWQWQVFQLPSRTRSALSRGWVIVLLFFWSMHDALLLLCSSFSIPISCSTFFSLPPTLHLTPWKSMTWSLHPPWVKSPTHLLTLVTSAAWYK